MEFISKIHPILQSIIATMFTYGLTALGAMLVFFIKKVNRTILDSILGFGAGVMIAASFWSLLSPAIDLSVELGYNTWLIPSIGFIFGGIFIVLASKLLDKYSFFNRGEDEKNSSLKRSILLVTAVTLHNIPEGLAVGVAIGSVAQGVQGTDMIGAILLTIGIGLQNFPEGASVSLPLRRDGFSIRKSFFYGQLSGIVEPIAGVIGVLAALSMRSILPFLLSFSAGSMIAVVAAELIPESAKNSKNLATIGVIIGFTIMMILDVALS